MGPIPEEHMHEGSLIADHVQEAHPDIWASGDRANACSAYAVDAIYGATQQGSRHLIDNGLELESLANFLLGQAYIAVMAITGKCPCGCMVGVRPVQDRAPGDPGDVPNE